MTRIALIEPLGDPGIGTYAYELASAIDGMGVHVDVLTVPGAWTSSLPRRHRMIPVVGSALIRQRSALRAATSDTRAAVVNDSAERAMPAPAGRRSLPRYLRGRLRDSYLSAELAVWLKARRYDVLWTQWPWHPARAISMWTAARAVGLHVVHTAHNVFPHEIAAGDRERCGHVYRQSDRIVVHSEMARTCLVDAFPFAHDKVVVAPHGLYTAYPRSPDGRRRVRAALGISPETTLALFYGGVRPYKNIESVIEALRVDSTRSFELLVAGRESGYPGSNRGDPLQRTRALAASAGVTDRVHLMPDTFTFAETSDLLEAADVVMLPYLESWGSGLLCLAMSFGRPVMATRTGGMEEYLVRYPASVVLDSPAPDAILSGIQTIRQWPARGVPQAPRPADLEWSSIVRGLLPQILP